MVSEILSRFPEDLYLPVDRPQYLKYLIRGYNRMAGKKVHVLGLARDLGRVCPYTIARINKLGGLFLDYRVTILENDSVDGTGDRLRRESRLNDNWTVLSETHGTPRYGSTKEEARARQMATLRNQLLDYSRDYPAEYVILLDMDLAGGFSYDGIAHTFSLPNWDMVGSNSLVYENRDGKLIRLYYDSWAFRYLGSVAQHTSEQINLLRFDRGEAPVMLRSCFGGLGVYRSEAYYCGAKYNFVNSLGQIECDHVTFHEQMSNAGYNKILMNPSQITLYSRNPYTL